MTLVGLPVINLVYNSILLLVNKFVNDHKKIFDDCVKKF